MFTDVFKLLKEQNAEIINIGSLQNNQICVFYDNYGY